MLYDHYTLPHAVTILIANDEEEFFAGLDDRIYSRLTGTTRIRFTEYEMDELVAILEDRVRWGLNQNVIETTQLEEIADATAGDARIAIGIVRAADLIYRMIRHPADDVSDSALEELRTAYARGGLSDEEFERRRERLERE